MNFLQATRKQRTQKKPFLAVFRQKEKTRSPVISTRFRVHFIWRVGTLHANVLIFCVVESYFASNAQAILYFYTLEIVTHSTRNCNAHGKGGYKFPYISLISQPIFRLVALFLVCFEGLRGFLQFLIRYL